MLAPGMAMPCNLNSYDFSSCNVVLTGRSICLELRFQVSNVYLTVFQQCKSTGRVPKKCKTTESIPKNTSPQNTIYVYYYIL